MYVQTKIFIFFFIKTNIYVFINKIGSKIIFQYTTINRYTILPEEGDIRKLIIVTKNLTTKINNILFCLSIKRQLHIERARIRTGFPF